MKTIIIKALAVIIGVSIILISICAISCQLSPEGIIFITGDYSCPKCDSFSIQTCSNAIINFSEKIELESIKLINDTESQEIPCNIQINEDDKDSDSSNFSIVFLEDTVPEHEYTLSGIAKDKKNNSLTFCYTFTGYNNKVPKLVISEVRTESSKLKYEYIELVALSQGNLGGVQILCGYDSEKGIFTFPSVNVKKDEYITVHYRKSEEGSISELNKEDISYEQELSQSVATDSCNTARDFWIDNIDARIQKTDVILLKNRKEGEIIDAVLFSESSNTEWKKELQKEYALQAIDSKIWFNNDYPQTLLNAANSDGITNTRTLSRQDLLMPSSKENWKIVATSNATPGFINSNKLYFSTQ